MCAQVRYGRGRKGRHKCWKQSLELVLFNISNSSNDMISNDDTTTKGARARACVYEYACM